MWVIKGVPDIFDSKEHAINFAKLIDRDMSRQELGPVPMDRQWEAELRGIDLEGEKEAEQALQGHKTKCMNGPMSIGPMSMKRKTKARRP